LAVILAIAAHAFLFVGTGLLIKYGSHPDLGAATWSYRIYYDYATQAVEGQVPYRDYLVEYPILTFPLFLVPRLFVSDFASYCIAFGVEMWLFDVAAIVLIARHIAETEVPGQVAVRLAWYTIFCAMLAPLVVGRFELAPMVVAFAAARWWFSGRPGLGGVTAGVGALLKVFPGLVAVVAMAWEATRLRASRARGTLAFAATMAIGVAGWFALGGANVLESFRYHAAPIQRPQVYVMRATLFPAIVFTAGAITKEMGIPVSLSFILICLQLALLLRPGLRQERLSAWPRCWVEGEVAGTPCLLRCSRTAGDTIIDAHEAAPCERLRNRYRPWQPGSSRSHMPSRLPAPVGPGPPS
jgi:hypothetical protein